MTRVVPLGGRAPVTGYFLWQVPFTKSEWQRYLAVCSQQRSGFGYLGSSTEHKLYDRIRSRLLALDFDTDALPINIQFLPEAKRRSSARRSSRRLLANGRMYHATRRPLAISDKAFSCTPDREAALEYLEGGSGFLYEIRLPEGLRLATERDVFAMKREIDPDEPYNAAWEIVEELRSVRTALQADFDGLDIEDYTPDNRSMHRTITLWKPLSLGVAAQLIEEIDP